MASCPSCRGEVAPDARFCARCGHPLASAGGPDPLVGALLDGRYRVEARLGRGGMATVYLARHEGLGRHVAVKLLHENVSQDYPSVERFRREARAISRIAHPNVVSVLDFALDREQGRFFLAMEHVAGISLRTAIEKGGAFDVGRAVHVLSQLAAALRECHAKQIVHRDLKAENVMLTRRGHDASFVKLLDFGLTRAMRADPEIARLTRTQQVLGSPICMAPEQWRGESLDERTDVYALGILAYELLTGGPPFEAETPFAWFLWHVEGTVEPPSRRRSEVPRSIDDLVLRCLAKDPASRFASMDEVMRALGAIWRREELRAPAGRVSYAGSPAAPIVPTDLAYAATLARDASCLDAVRDAPDLCGAASRVASLVGHTLADLAARAWPAGMPQGIRDRIAQLERTEADVSGEVVTLADLRDRAEERDTVAAVRRATLSGELLDASGDADTMDQVVDPRPSIEAKLSDLDRERERTQAAMEQEVAEHLREAQRRLTAFGEQCDALSEAISAEGIELDWDDEELVTLRGALSGLQRAIGSIGPDP